MKQQNVLVVGSGGREHALAWKLRQSPKVENVFVAPGNAGTAKTGENVPIPSTDIPGLIGFAAEKGISLTVVGPDEPLALGIVDAFREKGLRIVGPTKAAARIEWSKAFAKELMSEANIPTAACVICPNAETALAHLETRSFPVVIKASGLAAGKGAFICHTRAQAEAALRHIGTLSCLNEERDIIVEDFLQGKELSIHVLCDGKSTVLFPAAQDHKQLGDGDTGPMTGGMGAIVPVPGLTAGFEMRLRRQIVDPMLAHLELRRIPFTGLMYPGIIVTPEGPKALEYNARFGDPEAQEYLRLLKTDLFELLSACADGQLSKLFVQWHSGCAVSIALVSQGYGISESFETGFPISGLEEAAALQGIVMFHGGTAVKDGQLVTAGGRVLHVTATAETLPEALDRAYAAVRCIRFEGMQYRHDIGARALASLPKT